MNSETSRASASLPPLTIHWFRRDLRFEDNAGLAAALSSGRPVLPLFIFDSDILERLPSRADRRVSFIHETVQSLQAELQAQGSALLVEIGRPIEVWERLLERFQIESVTWNRDYEPYAVDRDLSVERLLRSRGISVQTFKDQVIFEKQEVAKDAGGTYTVFTPYSKKWKSTLAEQGLKSHKSSVASDSFLKISKSSKVSKGLSKMPTLLELGFEPAHFEVPQVSINKKLIAAYAKERDWPEKKATSRLGVHLRFGTISVRRAVKEALVLSEIWLNELIWREFFMQILWNHPHVVTGSFRPEYDKIPFRHDQAEFEAWCEGRTGYPLVDAGMRELSATGFMHNRVRMVAASFLVKHLLIDWRWGERYFASQLLDFELASNNGNWQWVAGSGCDAAPYFRIFNPMSQERKFDPRRNYVRRWVPEFETSEYPQPLVDHAFARARVLEAYGLALGKLIAK